MRVPGVTNKIVEGATLALRWVYVVRSHPLWCGRYHCCMFLPNIRQFMRGRVAVVSFPQRTKPSYLLIMFNRTYIKHRRRTGWG